jgi:hypothetical protein
MRAQAYTLVNGVIVVTVATARSEPTGSAKFTAANIHHDYASQVRALLREHKHVGVSAEAYPAARRLQTYFPTHGGDPLYSILELIPAGAPRDVDDAWQLEFTRLRYSITLNLLSAAFIADEQIAEGVERNVEYAVWRLFQANSLPGAYLPGDMTIRLGTGTEVDIMCELGPASGRHAVEVLV